MAKKKARKKKSRDDKRNAALAKRSKK